MAYHHGDLPAALLAAAIEEIDAAGLTAMSLRKVAGRAGVSHTAAAHHFGDKAGMLTALAIQGHQRLANHLSSAEDDLLSLGTAYVRFAATNPGHFAVMFQPDLHHRDDPELRDAAAHTWSLLVQAAGSDDLATTSWAFAHGIATLYLAGNLPASTPTEVVALTRQAAANLPQLGTMAAHHEAPG